MFSTWLFIGSTLQTTNNVDNAKTIILLFFIYSHLLYSLSSLNLYKVYTCIYCLSELPLPLLIWKKHIVAIPINAPICIETIDIIISFIVSPSFVKKDSKSFDLLSLTFIYFSLIGLIFALFDLCHLII